MDLLQSTTPSAITTSEIPEPILAILNTTVLSLLMLSVSTQRYSPITKSRFVKEYDYIVVGGGSAGSVIAGRLSEILCVRILLLEAGSSPPVLTEVPGLAPAFIGSDIDWKFRTEPQTHGSQGLINQKIKLSAGKVIGGSSIYNGMVYVRGNRNNYDDWAAQGAINWNYENVLKYFKKMETNTNINSPDIEKEYHGTSGPLTVSRPNYDSEIKLAVIEAAKELGYKLVDPNGRQQRGFYNIQSTMRLGQRCSAAKSYLVPNDYKPNLDIVSDALVTKIIIQNGRAVGVEFKKDNKIHTVNSKREVIVTAGAYGTPKILMLSGIGPRDHLEEMKIHVAADLPVGQNLQDHAGTVIPFTVSDDIDAYDKKLMNPVNVGEYLAVRRGPMTSSSTVAFSAFLNKNSTEAPDDRPDFQLLFSEAVFDSRYANALNIKPEVFNEAFAPYINKSGMFCIAHNLHPKSRGTVKLNSTNIHDPPVIDPKIFTDPEDLEDVLSAAKECYKIANSESLRKIGTSSPKSSHPGCEEFSGDEEEYLRCRIRSLSYTFFHEVGTAKMGNPEDPSTVVDPELRVKGITGLRVADASVMPLIPYGNMNTPVLMVAEKAADMIKSSIECL